MAMRFSSTGPGPLWGGGGGGGEYAHGPGDGLACVKFSKCER